MASAPEQVSQLKSKLQSDPQARAAFISGIKGVLQQQGVDVADQSVLTHIGLDEATLAGQPGRTAAMSSVIITITA
jgi:hypothetical protein